MGGMRLDSRFENHIYHSASPQTPRPTPRPTPQYQPTNIYRLPLISLSTLAAIFGMGLVLSGNTSAVTMQTTAIAANRVGIVCDACSGTSALINNNSIYANSSKNLQVFGSRRSVRLMGENVILPPSRMSAILFRYPR